MPNGFNQFATNSHDQNIRDQRLGTLYGQVKTFCNLHNITFALQCDEDAVTNSLHSKIIFMCLVDLIADYSHWKSLNELCRQQGKVFIILTDNIFDFEDLEFVKFFNPRELLGVSALYQDVTFALHEPRKLYNCFIQRVDSNRLSWFYFLCHYQLLDRGYVSLLLRQLTTYSDLTGRDLYDYIHQTYQLDQLPHFNNAYLEMRDSVPYRNFAEDGDLLSLISDSKYSLTLETYAIHDDREQWCFSEKTLRTLQIPNIPLLFAQKEGIKVLKNLGFEFGNHLDELDSLPWQQRQQELLKMLVNDEIDYNWNELYNQSKHNRELLESWRVQYQAPAFLDKFYNAVLEI